jgi:hypothetical protein
MAALLSKRIIQFRQISPFEIENDQFLQKKLHSRKKFLQPHAMLATLKIVVVYFYPVRVLF